MISVLISQHVVIHNYAYYIVFLFTGVISPGAIAGIILGLLLLLVLGVAVTVIVVFLVKHRQAGKEHSREDNVPSQVFRE